MGPYLYDVYARIFDTAAAEFAFGVAPGMVQSGCLLQAKDRVSLPAEKDIWRPVDGFEEVVRSGPCVGMDLVIRFREVSWS